MIFGGAGERLGEYIGGGTFSEYSNSLALWVSRSGADGWSIDLYTILLEKPSVLLSRQKLITGLTQAEVKGLSFRGGSLMWVRQNQANQLRLCSYEHKYVATSNSCVACSTN